MSLWADLEGWTPLRLFWQAEQAQVEWVWAGSAPVGGEFYDQWLSSLLERPFNQLFRRRTALADLLAQAGDMPPALPLSGIILHMSRCGSTLTARLLAALPEHRVISEPYILQKLILNLYPDPQIPDAQRIDWLRLLVKLLGARNSAGAQEQRLYIKLDALAGLRLDLVQRAFPEVPWVFLYRQPEEVLVSQCREIAGGLIPGYIDPALLGSDYATLLSLPLTEYIAMLLGRVCHEALAHLPNKGGLALNYRRLPQAAWGELADHFGLALTPAQIAAMQETARYNAKSSAAQLFRPDAQEKQAALTPAMRQAAQQWMAKDYAALESIDRA